MTSKLEILAELFELNIFTQLTFHEITIIKVLLTENGILITKWIIHLERKLLKHNTNPKEESLGKIISTADEGRSAG